MSVNRTSLGKRISFYRSKSNLTQEVLAAKVNCSREYIVQIENGTKVPSLSVLVKIANTLSVSADELLLDCLEYSSSSANSEIHRMHDARQKTKDTETQIKSVNEQIHYLGQYLSTKSTYNEFLKARFKGKFRKDHADEIEKHEKAAQILKAQNPDGSLPKMKDLKLEKERLLALKAAQYDTYTYYKDYQKELRTACANIDSILGQHHIRDHIQRTEQTL